MCSVPLPLDTPLPSPVWCGSGRQVVRFRAEIQGITAVLESRLVTAGIAIAAAGTGFACAGRVVGWPDMFDTSAGAR